MSERRESLPERRELQQLVQALATLVETADRLPAGPERTAAIEEIAGLHEKVNRLTISA
jgi:hypothetical protein